MKDVKVKVKALIIWAERSNGSKFPPYYSEQVLELVKFNGSFSDDTYDFKFDNTVYANGWWATERGKSGTCKVSLEVVDAVF